MSCNYTCPYQTRSSTDASPQQFQVCKLLDTQSTVAKFSCGGEGGPVRYQEVVAPFGRPGFSACVVIYICLDLLKVVLILRPHIAMKPYISFPAAATILYLCRLRKKQFKKEKAGEMVGLIDARSPEVYELMTANKQSDISPISAESWTEHLQSHSVQPQESVPDVLPGQFNVPTRYQVLSDQLRSGQVFPSDIAVPPGPGGRYRSMDTTFQRSKSEHQYTSW